jgi:hypothetical protein
MPNRRSIIDFFYFLLVCYDRSWLVISRVYPGSRLRLESQFQRLLPRQQLEENAIVEWLDSKYEARASQGEHSRQSLERGKYITRLRVDYVNAREFLL